MIVVTGATGKLGRHVIDGLLEKVAATEVVAAVRNPDKADDLKALGIEVRKADYSDPSTLPAAFAGAEKLLLISSNEIEKRIPQQKAVVDAAKAAGVKLIAYTGILHGDASKLEIASDHKITEAYIRASGVPFVFLRNGWYFENQTEALAPAVQHGAIIGAAGEGRFAAASRLDYAGAAVAVLTTPGHENAAYELVGDKPYTYAELAAEVSAVTGKTVVYRNLSEDEYAKALAGFGLPEAFAKVLADADARAGEGELDDASHTLSRLIGRPTQSLHDAVASALKAS